MFIATLKSGVLFKNLVEVVRHLLAEQTLHFSQDGLRLQAMDPKHCSLCTMQLPSEAFANYRCDRDISLGLDVTKLARFLKSLGNEDKLTFLHEEGAKLFTLKIENEYRTSRFDMILKDLDVEDIGVPEPDYAVRMRMPSALFHSIVRDMTVIGENCIISCTDDELCFSGENDDNDTLKVTMKQNTTSRNALNFIVLTVKRPVPGLLFSLRYLAIFAKATTLCHVVDISLNPDFPIIVEYPIGESGGFLRWHLAPRVEVEEEFKEVQAACPGSTSGKGDSHELSEPSDAKEVAEDKPRPKVLHPCINCNAPTHRRCARCRTAYICSHACQVETIEAHKPICLEIVEERAAREGAEDT